MVDAQIETCGWARDFTCVIKERVVVAWHEDGEEEMRYFGCLAEDGKDCKDCKGNLYLEIHRSKEAHRACLVNFRLPVKISPSTSKRAKDMYLVLPASSLAMTLVVEDTVSESVREHLPSAGSGGFYRIHLAMEGSDPPYAVMPEAVRRPGRLGKRVRGAPRRMLMYLKSLSKAKSWNVYLVGDRSMHHQIESVCESLNEGGVYEPNIDLGSMYPNGIRGLVNNWNDYPYSPTEAGSSLRNLPPKPPSYSEICNKYGSRHSPSDRSEKSPDCILIWNTSQRDSPTNQPLVTGKRKKDDAESSSDEGTGIHKRPGIAARPPASYPRLVSIFDHELAMARQLSPTQADSEGSVPFDDAKAPAADPANLTSPTGITVQDACENVSPRSSHPRVQSLSDARPNSFGKQVTEEHSIPLLQPSSSECRAHSAEWALYLDLVQFLLYTMSRDAQAYSVYKSYFLEMGARAKEQDAEGFHAAKRYCFRNLNKRAARRGLQPRSTPEEMEQQILSIGAWIDEEISRKAYMYVDRQFESIELVALKAEEAGLDDDVRQEFESRKAECLAAAFFTYEEIKNNRSRGSRVTRPPVLCTTCITRISSEHAFVM